ncbi:F-box domain [Macleaya cordata]|uniref:F-box domain n=1 Tax=Macleaya cordata TaxID=56857 RepID=A0A200QFD2_MACCD|nr:F-box domain [Macleaya cordata]
MGTVVGEDRISELPDPILHHILCFLPTKCSVSTSILSKRWRYLWTSIPVLDFREWRSLSDKLGMLSLHDDRPTIQKFYFYSDDDFDESRVIAWISTLIRHKVEELILSLEDDIHQFPPCFSTCESLTMLDLEAVTNLKLPFSFPRLKILWLTYIRFVDEKLTQQFFSNCPVLEELILTSCKWVVWVLYLFQLLH